MVLAFAIGYLPKRLKFPGRDICSWAQETCSRVVPVKGGRKQSQAAHGECLALIGVCYGKGTQRQKAGNMHGALVKAMMKSR